MKKNYTDLEEIISKQQKRAATDSALDERGKSGDEYNEEEEDPIPPPIQLQLPSQVGQYQIKGTIGEGAFSQVKLAYIPSASTYCACKTIQKQRLSKGNLEERFECEIRVHQQLHHPSIVEIYDLFTDKDFYYVMMEFCPGGELFQYIVDRGRLSEDRAQIFMKQLMESIAFIHRLGICHRDLKPENLLLDQYGCIKVSDFGLSRFLDPEGLSHTPCGSPCYASPECLSGRPFDGRKSDVWSCGVILYAMVTGQLPWTKRNQPQLFQQIRSGDFRICRDLIARMMTIDYKLRPSAEEVLKHPFLANVKVISNSVTHAGHIVSQKRVDAFFGKEDDFVPILLHREPSLGPEFNTFEKVVKQITKKNPKPPRRKPSIVSINDTSAVPRRKISHKKINNIVHKSAGISSYSNEAPTPEEENSLLVNQ